MKQFFFWAVLYQLVHGICGYLQQWIIPAHWVTPVGVATFLLLLILWIFHTGRAQALGLGLWPLPRGWDIPLTTLLFVPALINLFAGGMAPMPLSAVCLLICAALTEEILFRGFALRAFSASNLRNGILCSAGLFAILHSLNLLQGALLPDVLLQCVFAFFCRYLLRNRHPAHRQLTSLRTCPLPYQSYRHVLGS